MRIAPTVLASSIAMAGCYRPELDRCKVNCTDSCPGALSCLADGYCHAAADRALCTPDTDAAPPDATPPPPVMRALTAGAQHTAPGRKPATLKLTLVAGQTLTEKLALTGAGERPGSGGGSSGRGGSGPGSASAGAGSGSGSAVQKPPPDDDEGVIPAFGNQPP